MTRGEDQFCRSAAVFGEDSVGILAAAHVAVFGLGGVGGAAAEALARSGVGSLDLIDSDLVSESNINRQLVALHSTLGRRKVDVMRERILDINPNVAVSAKPVFFLPESQDSVDFLQYSYVIDAVDTVSAKILIIGLAKKNGIPVISAMGAGNKTRPELLRIADISKTSVCPLARVMRRELRKRGISGVPVVFSTEKPVVAGKAGSCEGRPVPGSTAFVPPAAGLLLASRVVADLLEFGR